jgi:hypothetical protein
MPNRLDEKKKRQNMLFPYKKFTVPQMGRRQNTQNPQEIRSYHRQHEMENKEMNSARTYVLSMILLVVAIVWCILHIDDVQMKYSDSQRVEFGLLRTQAAQEWVMR